MPGQNIGLTMPHGFAGSYARQPDLIVDSHHLGGSDQVVFGTALVYNTTGDVVPVSDANTAADFVGIAAREIKSAVNYHDQNVGCYVPGDAVSVLKRGCVNVICNVGVPKLGGNVYLRVKKNDAIPTGVVGGLEANADGDNTVLLTCCQWRGGSDANKVAEMRLLTCNRA